MNLRFFAITLLFLSQAACKSNAGTDTPQPSIVKIEEQNGTFTLYVNNEEFYIKGAGGNEKLDSLAAYGGNSIRTWGADNARTILDEAWKHGIMVMLGFWVQHERHGFDYNNEAAVEEQLQEFKTVVETYKDHPALLMWAIGNEMELNASNMKVWDAVNDMALAAKELDPNHPTITVVAEISSSKIERIKSQVPAIDVLGINSYGGLGSIPDRIRSFGWEKPYIVTEWGVNGHWEVGSTSWGAPIEPTSTQKAETYMTRYEDVIVKDKERCLGSYVFLWGQKQERTPTWHGLFLESGEETPAVDVMQKMWSGAWPANRAPEITAITLQNKSPNQNVQIQLDKVATGKVTASDPDGDPLSYKWFIIPESTSTSEGGDAETKPEEIEGLIIAASDGEVTFSMPDQPGAYRLFVYVFDGNNNAGAANIPFYVYE